LRVCSAPAAGADLLVAGLVVVARLLAAVAGLVVSPAAWLQETVAGLVALAAAWRLRPGCWPVLVAGVVLRDPGGSLFFVTAACLVSPWWWGHGLVVLVEAPWWCFEKCQASSGGGVVEVTGYYHGHERALGVVQSGESLHR
jgi:hypothetical protein